MLSFYSSVDNHRGMVFDISARSLLGKYDSRIVRARCRRLISKNSGSVSKYNERFEGQIHRHKLRERLETLEIAIGDEERLTKEQTEQFETIHKQTTEIQFHAERKCRKIIKPDLDFSEEVNFWHARVNAWRALLHRK